MIAARKHFTFEVLLAPTFSINFIDAVHTEKSAAVSHAMSECLLILNEEKEITTR